MDSFSERYGYKPARKVLQVEAIDGELRNGLWSAFNDTVLANFESGSFANRNDTVASSNLEPLFHGLWRDVFKIPTDSMPAFVEFVARDIRKRFFAFAWNEVYDFVEYVSSSLRNSSVFDNYCNTILERENADVRMVGNIAVRVTAPEEVAAIDDALSSTERGVREHLASALRLLSDRHKPDYRNSIKESISAVEAVCRELSSKEKATLGDALKAVAARAPVHPALRDAFLKMYGYASDEGGIRHAMLDEATVDYTDAKFMLVVCSAFVGYLRGKAARPSGR